MSDILSHQGSAVLGEAVPHWKERLELGLLVGILKSACRSVEWLFDDCRVLTIENDCQILDLNLRVSVVAAVVLGVVMQVWGVDRSGYGLVVSVLRLSWSVCCWGVSMAGLCNQVRKSTIIYICIYIYTCVHIQHICTYISYIYTCVHIQHICTYMYHILCIYVCTYVCSTCVYMLDI